MSEFTAAELTRALIETAKNQYRGCHYAESLKTLARAKDIYRDAFTPLPKHFEATVEMVQAALDKEKLALTKW